MTTYRYLDDWDLPDYCVGDNGSVWSLFTRNGKRTDTWRRMKPVKMGLYGHVAVSLSRTDRTIWRCGVHRLVLLTFVGPCPEGMQCRHLDGDAGNNHLTNLRWGTPKEDRQDMIRHGRLKIPHYHGSRNGSAKLKAKDVRLIRLMGKEKEYTQVEIARIFDIHRTCVQSIIYRKTWSHLK